MSCKQMSRKGMLVAPAVWLLATAWIQAGECAGGSCPAGPQAGGNWAYPGGLPTTHCPKNWWCMPKPPCLCPKCVCPKPLCDPCDLENYGYYPTCWRPWLQQTNWSHCPVPPPTVLAPHFHPKVELVPADPEELLPAPKKDK